MAEGSSNPEGGTTRRNFLKRGFSVAGAAVVGVLGFGKAMTVIGERTRENIDNPDAYPPDKIPPRLQTPSTLTPDQEIREKINPGYKPPASNLKP